MKNVIQFPRSIAASSGDNANSANIQRPCDPRSDGWHETLDDAALLLRRLLEFKKTLERAIAQDGRSDGQP